MKKLLLSTLCTLTLTAFSTHAQTIKRAEEVFKKWFEWQQIMPDNNISDMDQYLDDNFLGAFKTQYEKTAPILAPIAPFLQVLTAGHINQHGYYLRSPLSNQLRDNLSALYSLIQDDISGFISFIKTSQLRSPENIANEENGELSNSCIEKYNALFKLIFVHPEEKIQNQYLFSLANRFFEYCFSEETYQDFEKTLFNKSNYPINRMLYSIIWQNLAGNGWKHWHQNSLKALKEKADQGNQIVYIAGGSDIYHLLKAGIYNIKNIDPQLPSQPKYYADDWQFVLAGSLGDRIIFKFDNRMIFMERTGFVQTGRNFKARIATGDVIELPESITTWAIADHAGVKLGEYILERRFCQQEDFISGQNKTILMSFNELYFACLPNHLNGWQIEPSRFPSNLSIIIKQLRKPVSKQVAVNIRVASLLNSTDFKFIALGTCIN